MVSIHCDSLFLLFIHKKVGKNITQTFFLPKTSWKITWLHTYNSFISVNCLKHCMCFYSHFSTFDIRFMLDTASWQWIRTQLGCRVATDSYLAVIIKLTEITYNWFMYQTILHDTISPRIVLFDLKEKEFRKDWVWPFSIYICDTCFKGLRLTAEELGQKTRTWTKIVCLLNTCKMHDFLICLLGKVTFAKQQE
jgi:hypothetical protein